MNLGRAYAIIICVFTGMLLSGLNPCIANNSIEIEKNLQSSELFEGFLYFADKDSMFLKSVQQRFPFGKSSNELGVAIIQSLIQGPPVSNLETTLPEDTKINTFFITAQGEAFVDLDFDLDKAGKMDTQSELLAIYSIVNSLTLNIDEIKKVKILVKGNEAITFAGHVDLGYFYKTNMMIVK